MKKGLFLCLWGMVATGILHAQSWLPKSLDNRRAFRAVECQYEKACLQECREVGHDWKLQLDSIVQDGMTMYCFTFTAPGVCDGLGFHGLLPEGFSPYFESDTAAFP